jgi:hypothetical protein
MPKYPGCAKTKTDLVVMSSGGRIFVFFCSERDHKPQNCGCGYTAQSFHTAWVTQRHQSMSASAAAFTGSRHGRPPHVGGRDPVWKVGPAIRGAGAKPSTPPSPLMRSTPGGH